MQTPEPRAARDHRKRLRKLCREAERDLLWPDLAKFIDGLHEEYETFIDKINKRKVGAHVNH